MYASFNLVFILGGFGFRNYSILHQYWLHCGTLWGLWRGPVEEKLPSRTEGRCGQLASIHFKRFWFQKAGSRPSKIDKNSMKKRCKNQWEIRMGFCMASGAFLVDFWGVCGTLDPLKWMSRISEVLISKVLTFSCLGWLFGDFVTFWDAFGKNFGSQSATNMTSHFC